jgi:hypothetical protein
MVSRRGERGRSGWAHGRHGVRPTRPVSPSRRSRNLLPAAAHRLFLAAWLAATGLLRCTHRSWSPLRHGRRTVGTSERGRSPAAGVLLGDDHDDRSGVAFTGGRCRWPWLSVAAARGRDLDPPGALLLLGATVRASCPSASPGAWAAGQRLRLRAPAGPPLPCAGPFLLGPDHSVSAAETVGHRHVSFMALLLPAAAVSVGDGTLPAGLRRALPARNHRGIRSFGCCWWPPASSTCT